MKKISLALASLSILALSACGIPQSPECAAYLECAAHYDTEFETDTAGTLEEAYGEGGTCWSSAATAETCTTTCTDTIASLREGLETAEKDVGACAE